MNANRKQDFPNGIEAFRKKNLSAKNILITFNSDYSVCFDKKDFASFHV